MIRQPRDWMISPLLLREMQKHIGHQIRVLSLISGAVFAAAQRLPHTHTHAQTQPAPKKKLTSVETAQVFTARPSCTQVVGKERGMGWGWGWGPTSTY